MDRVREIVKELRIVLTGRSNLLDSLLPPVFFALFNAVWGVQVAV